MTQAVKDTGATFLERRMLEKGFNMKSLSIAAGLGTTAVRDILVGRNRRPGGEVWMKLAEVLECSVRTLMLDFVSAPAAPEPAGEISPREKAMLDLFRALPTEEQDRFMKVAAALAQPADDTSGDGTNG